MEQPKKRIRIGDLLVEHKLISEGQLSAALADQKTSGRKLGQVLIENSYISEEKFLDFLSRQLNVPYIDLKQYKYQKEVVHLLPETLARRYRAIVLADRKSGLLVGMVDPSDIFAYDDIHKILKRPMSLALIREQDLLGAMDIVYRREDEISSLAEELDDELSETDIVLDQLAQSDDVENAPVVRLLHTIFEDALQVKASDIHIEPDEKVLRIRMRIDGVLNEQVMNEKRIVAALVSRLKLMSGLNISERRLPQDGRFHIKVHQHSIDVRLSTMPTQHGESVVMRLLDQSEGTLNLDELGMNEAILGRFRKAIHRPHGLVLLTGPTGSGKTTTLYAALNELNTSEKKIITAEDPVEYRLERISQVQVNSKIGLSFSNVLRTALRQDPDIILIGEMRDPETADIAVRSAMTGHMVLSTLHTNDAVSSVYRLQDMGIEGYLIATSLQAIVAQRLVRKLCENCKTEHELDEHEMSWLQGAVDETVSNNQFFQGAGCHFCNNSGYKGRKGVHEILEINETLADAFRHGDAKDFVQQARVAPGYKPLVNSALDLARQGVTSIEEVLRLAGTIDEHDEYEEKE
ncbi:MAG: Flp pilus assembly complex ATPase component TadA [gamma proteobacterium symbiont of Bathyaustriella thionipta]|nr:Flp pilus assembly complex ATPase component TadA [gamma proteobacterium symbiont of Bathyaustriella thionipta]MCU7950836.1 Flp pilus assembly complex ATPase component TadA [gamma proteobacterium symbiont of Bathyaustriella thionipta]MCU7952288.1 Flp pilus assembly complex ATPase component TadA [gamma proteobacterium symbiont of Bathyaustriella thionipta]MCU7957358.1 Flp pilus assembly complex ATPase component TadA [gamma proteobacterium symbiont of Bathyaustriella thionipta]MCU7966733.1 Flp 